MAVAHDMTMMDDDYIFFHLHFQKPGSIALHFVVYIILLLSFKLSCDLYSKFLFFSFVVVVLFLKNFIRFPVLELTMTLDEVFFFPFFPFFFFGMVCELRYTRIHTFFDDQEFGPVFF